MGGEIANLQASLSGYVVPEVALRIDDPWFGVGNFSDYGSTPPRPYENNQDITDDIPAVQAAIDSLTLLGGWPDWVESQTAALHATATGLDVACGPGPASCAGGRLGYPCFRLDAQPIVVLITDAGFHNGVRDTLDGDVVVGASGCSVFDGCYELGSGGCTCPCFPLDPPCPSLETVVGELNTLGAKVIGIWSGSWPGDTGQVQTWGWGRTYPDYDEAIDLYYTVDQTGSVDGSGNPFMYGIPTDGSGIDVEIVNAIDDLVATMLLDVSATWYDADPLAPDTSVLIEDVDPTSCTMCASLDAATNTAVGVQPGSDVTFSVTLSNDTGEIPATPDAQTHEVVVQLWSDGTSVIGERTFRLLVPGTDISVPAITGRYWHDYDALTTCTALQTPM